MRASFLRKTSFLQHSVDEVLSWTESGIAILDIPDPAVPTIKAVYIIILPHIQFYSVVIVILGFLPLTPLILLMISINSSSTSTSIFSSSCVQVVVV